MRHLGLAFVLLCPPGGAVAAQEPSGPPPPSSNRTSTGIAPYELLPDLGRIGAQAGFVGSVSWNPYSVGQGFELGGYIDLPLFRAPGGRVSYEMLVAFSHGRSDPFTITDPIAYVANLASGANVSDALAGPPRAPFPVRRGVTTDLSLLQVSPFATQRPARQQPPPSQRSPPQQASPVPPHFAQMFPVQIVPAPQALLPRQHGSPGPPQATQDPPVGTLVVQRAPGSQVEPQHV